MMAFLEQISFVYIFATQMKMNKHTKRTKKLS